MSWVRLAIATVVVILFLEVVVSPLGPLWTALVIVGGLPVMWAVDRAVQHFRR